MDCDGSSTTAVFNSQLHIHSCVRNYIYSTRNIVIRFWLHLTKANLREKNA